MVTKESLEEVKTYILRELPRVLEQDPQFITFVRHIVEEHSPSREEFARLSDTVQDMRSEMHQRFEQVDQRFEQVDQRFEQVDQRFEQVDQNIASVRLEVQDLRTEMHQGFAHMQQSINDLRHWSETKIEQLQQDFSHMRLDMAGLRDWSELTIGRLQTRAGRKLEDVVAGALRFGLKRSDISPEHITLRQKIYDPTGLVFAPGKQKEVDIIAQNSSLLVFEVKSAPDPDDVDSFADKVKLVSLQNPDKHVSGVFITLSPEDDVRQKCKECGIQLVP